MNTRAKIQYLQNLPEPVLSEVVDFAKSLQVQDKNKKSKNESKMLKDFLGKLKDSPNFNGDLVKLQRKWRGGRS